jgi:hypothetical protein
MSLSTLRTENDKSCQYNKPEDWINWSHQFRLRAKTLNLWQYIDPDNQEPWPIRPSAPLIRSYRRRPEPQPSVSTPKPVSKQKGKGKATQQPGPSTRPSTRSTPSEEDAIEVDVLNTMAELTPNDKAEYQHDWQVFIFLSKDYKDHQDKLEKLVTWTLSTISYTLQQTCCIKNELLDQWYLSLQETGIVYEENLLPEARERYQQAVKQMTKPLKSFEN